MKLYLCLGCSFSKEVQRRSAFIGIEQMIRWGSSFLDWCIWWLCAAIFWCVLTLSLQHSTRIPGPAIVSMCSLYIHEIRMPESATCSCWNRIKLPRSLPGQGLVRSLTCLKSKVVYTELYAVYSWYFTVVLCLNGLCFGQTTNSDIKSSSNSLSPQSLHTTVQMVQPFSSFSHGSFYDIPTGCKLGGKRRQVAWDLRPAEGKAWHCHGVFQFND